MKLFIEVGPILGERSGIGQYTKRLIEAYHTHVPNQEIRLFGFKFITRKLTFPIDNDAKLNYKIIRWLPRGVYSVLFKKRVYLPIDLLMNIKKDDVVLYTNFIKWPHAFNKKSVAVLHDVSFITHSQFTSPANKKYMLENVPKTIDSVSHIITISKNSKQDIIKHYGVNKDKISIVYPFVNTHEIKRADNQSIEKTKKKYFINKKYLLFIGNIEPRKNLIGTLEAYEKLPAKVKDSHLLVIAGGKGWLNDEIYEKINVLNQNYKHVVTTGYVPDDEIPSLISGAEIFIFIPHYEGFGIPPLEAMACGVPVISSNNSSLPEAVGKGGYYVSADRPQETTSAVVRILGDKKLRQNLIENGYRQIKKFTPEASALELDRVVQKISNL